MAGGQTNSIRALGREGLAQSQAQPRVLGGYHEVLVMSVDLTPGYRTGAGSRTSSMILQ